MVVNADDSRWVGPACCAGGRASRPRGARACEAPGVFGAIQTEKLKILAEYERRSPVMRSALLRREGLYTSSISEWRRQRDAGALLDGTTGQ